MLSIEVFTTEWLEYGGALCGAVVACLSFLLPPRSLTRVSFGVGMGLLALETLFATLSAGAVSLTDAARWQELRMAALSLVPATWLLFSLVFARGNRAEFLSRWWPGLVVALVAPLAVIYLLPGQLLSIVVASQEGGGLWFGLGRKGMLLHGLLLCSYIMVLVNLERTFRASVGVMRWRIKFIIVGLGLLFLMRVYTSSQKLLYHGWQDSLDVAQALALLAASFLIVWSVARCGLGEADVYPSRAVIFGSVTFSLVGVYLLLVGVLAKGVAVWGGAQALPLQALVILVGLGLLGVFLVSDRARLSLRLMLSRHFRRPFYDYREIWQRFTERTVSAVEPAALCGMACSFISEVFQTLSVTVWVFEPGGQRLRFGGSTTLTEDQAEDLLPGARFPEPAWNALRKGGDLIDLDKATLPELKSLQALCAVQFQRKGGHKFVLPLLTKDKLVGLLALSDRVNGQHYSAEERDLLHTLGLEVASALLNLQLLQRRSDARETEALRTMAAFFAHDLKNTGSTLSLTLQNLRRHYGNPEFREDALQAVSKCVDHINHVVEGLGTLQRELNLNLRSGDLNALVRQTLSEISAAVGSEVALDLQQTPPVLMDSQQMKKVLVNLLLNARDALSDPGHIEVGTEAQGPWVCLKVADNGCGMNTEFLRKSLFRPFQTTKKKGLGIGMFQSRTIIEAHGGRIEVESRVNVGTTFRVLLPVQESTH